MSATCEQSFQGDRGGESAPRVVEFMVASPRDAKPLHDVVRRVFDRWNRMHGESRGIFLLARTGRTDVAPEMARRTQDVPNRRLLPRTKALIAVFWTRIGTATDLHESGTVEEIARHSAAGKRVMIYFADMPTRPSDIDMDQYRRLTAYRKEWSEKAWVGQFSTAEEFEAVLYRDMEIVMNSEDGGGTADTEGGTPTDPAPSNDALSHTARDSEKSSAQQPSPARDLTSVDENADDIEQEAAQWLVRVDADASPERYAELDRFLSRNPRHRAAFLRLSVAWRRANALKNLVPLDQRVDPDLLRL
jgi:hypothetical protein